jgi:exosortase/archaeosortase family protein
MADDTSRQHPPHDRAHSAPHGGRARRPTLLGNERSRPVFGFLLRFLLIWAVALTLATLIPRIETWAIASTLWSIAVVLRPFTSHAVTAGSMLQVGGVSFQIVSDCTPLMPTAALWAAIGAFPSTWRWKLIGLGVGSLIVWLYNIGRILALVPVMAHRPQWFEFVHVYLWQTVTLLVVFACFLAWLHLQPVAERAR